MTTEDADRLEAKVTKDGPEISGMPSRCWEWIGSKDKRGFPKFWLGGNSVTAQRAVYLVAGKDLQPGTQVINVCGNRLCVRPDHLIAGTPLQISFYRQQGALHGW